ncbi:MAG: thioredoxin family protein [Bacteroidales bacterium]|jgi:thioredoxin 1|nr:thioredoxin family protein [Bacteroidales bacterium]
MKNIYSIQDLQAVIKNETMLVVYYSNDACSVCKVLKPKISEMLAQQFPKVEPIYIDIEKSPVISGQYRVFSIPTIYIYVEGKEHARFSRNVTLFDFERAIQKPYEILFSE